MRRHEVVSIFLEGGRERVDVRRQMLLGDIKERERQQLVLGGEIVDGGAPRVEGSRGETRAAAGAVQEGPVAQESSRGADLGRGGQRELCVGVHVVDIAVGEGSVEEGDELAYVEVADCEDDFAFFQVDAASFGADLATGLEEWVVDGGSVGDLDDDRLGDQDETIDLVAELGFEFQEVGVLLDAGGQAVAQVVVRLLAQERAWGVVTSHPL